MEKYAIIETVFDEEYKIVIRSRFSEEVYMFLADTYYVGDSHKNTARINRFISYEAANKALVELNMLSNGDEIQEPKEKTK